MEAEAVVVIGTKTNAGEAEADRDAINFLMNRCDRFHRMRIK
jgi:hypothetical protein